MAPFVPTKANVMIPGSLVVHYGNPNTTHPYPACRTPIEDSECLPFRETADPVWCEKCLRLTS
jgi:hypothetical protein